MERAAYKFIEQAENSWWYRGRRWFVERALARVMVPSGTVLDFGAGFGASFGFLNSYGTVDAYEIDEESSAACARRGYRTVYREMPPHTNRYTFIGAFDVIEHLQDDVTALQDLYARTEKDGVIVITVPAYAWLWSAHDELHKHFRRYDKKDISAILTKAGFTVTYATYWNMILLPVAYCLRKIGKGGGESLTPMPFINYVLSALLWIESRCTPFLSLPWGTGIVVVAHKL